MTSAVRHSHVCASFPQTPRAAAFPPQTTTKARKMTSNLACRLPSNIANLRRASLVLPLRPAASSLALSLSSSSFLLFSSLSPSPSAAPSYSSSSSSSATAAMDFVDQKQVVERVKNPASTSFVPPYPLERRSMPVGTLLKPTDVKLFQPLKLRGLTLKNRIGVAPMCMYSCHDGHANDFHLAHIGSYALGGAGLIIMEASGVVAHGRISPFDLGVYKDSHIAPLKRIVDFCHSQNAAISIQLAHAGRKASTFPPFIGQGHDFAVPVEQGGWENIEGPSAVKFSENYRLPAELSKEEIKSTIQSFVAAAKRVDAAGFDSVEIHGAHGYLGSSFLSPVANKRTDEYGGSFENRIRFIVELSIAVRSVWPAQKPLFVRISAVDWVPDGWTLEESVELAKRLHAVGVDCIDVSSAGNSTDLSRMKVGPGYQVPFAEAIKKQVPQIATATVGIITEPKQAEEILQEGKADLILLGRQFLREHQWPYRAARELGVQMMWAPQYMRAKV